MARSRKRTVAKQSQVGIAAAREMLGGGLAGIFDMLEVCGEEADRSSDVSSELWTMLAPAEIFRGVAIQVYRSHVRELLRRAKAVGDLGLGTDAEVLLGLREASLVAPLTRGGTMLYHVVFRRVMGEAAYVELFEDRDRERWTGERWDGELDELCSEARRKVRTGRPKKLAA